jgi:hypothetical protein
MFPPLSCSFLAFPFPVTTKQLRIKADVKAQRKYRVQTQELGRKDSIFRWVGAVLANGGS